MTIFFLAGMSESGKSFVGSFLEETKNFKRLKIIQIEKELMQEYGINYGTTKQELEKGLKLLYLNKNIFRDFLEKVKNKSQNHNVTLESLYRKELYLALKKLHSQTYCIFLKADKKLRIQRELKKSNLSIEELEKIFENKEKFKTKHNAPLVEQVADYVVDNNDSIDKLKLNILKIIDSKI